MSIQKQWYDIPGWPYQIDSNGQVRGIKTERVISSRFWGLHLHVHLTKPHRGFKKNKYNDNKIPIWKLMLMVFEPNIDLSRVRRVKYLDNNPYNLSIKNLIVETNIIIDSNKVPIYYKKEEKYDK